MSPLLSLPLNNLLFAENSDTTLNKAIYNEMRKKSWNMNSFRSKVKNDENVAVASYMLENAEQGPHKGQNAAALLWELVSVYLLKLS